MSPVASIDVYVPYGYAVVEHDQPITTLRIMVAPPDTFGILPFIVLKGRIAQVSTRYYALVHLASGRVGSHENLSTVESVQRLAAMAHDKSLRPTTTDGIAIHSTKEGPPGWWYQAVQRGRGYQNQVPLPGFSLHYTPSPTPSPEIR